jgi:hypothetical protein
VRPYFIKNNRSIANEIEDQRGRCLLWKVGAPNGQTTEAEV